MKKMNPTIVVVALLSGSFAFTNYVSGEDHSDHDHSGHDHALHIEEPVAHAEEGHDEHADEDEHAGHDHDEHENENKGHEGHDEELGHDDHAGHGHDAPVAADEEEEGGLRLTAEQLEHYGIVMKTAGAGMLNNELSLPGEVVFNEDRLVHLVPLVAGIVQDVHKTVGDSVAVGEVMAVMNSRELAEAKALYMATMARKEMTDKSIQREKQLFEKKISSEQDYLEAQQDFTEASIEFQTAEQTLHALGVSEKALQALTKKDHSNITRYELRAPMAGTVVEKHVSHGESLDSSVEVFTIADLSSVWVNLTVYIKDLDSVRKGQKVTLKVDHSGAQLEGVISMVTPFIDEATRSATARVLIDNSDGRWRPGIFVTGQISISEEPSAVVIPRNAVQVIEDKMVVFVQHEGAFEMVPVTTGHSDRLNVEIISGLKAGTEYVAEGAFGLKATVVTSNLDSHAGHGH